MHAAALILALPLLQAPGGPAQDALAGEGPADELAGGLSATFLAGDAERLDELLAERARLASEHAGASFATLVDLSASDELARVAASDRALDAALDDGGVVPLDATGETARGLGAAVGSIELLRVSPERLVVAEVELPGAAPEAEAAALGESP